MKKALIIRYGAYGDIIHMSHLPRLLKDVGYDIVDVETNFKGFQLLDGNPFIDNISGINPEFAFHNRTDMLIKHWQVIGEPYDLVINLINSIESGALAMENENIYYMSSEARRARYSDLIFYDVTTRFSGFPELIGKYTGEVYFTEDEEVRVCDWMKQFDGKFTVMMNLSGTGPHKRFVNAEEVAREILDKYDDAHIITTGGPDCSKLDFSGDRITSIVGEFPFRQALLVAKHMNCVIGCESGIMCGASMWDVPTIQLMTAASIKNHCGLSKNDYSLQSPAYCSPCHRGPYEYRGCPHKDGNPLCVYFNTNDIMNKVGEIYELTV